VHDAAVIEWLGVGVRGTDGAWIVRGVSARLSLPELTAVVSTDALARRALLDATVGRVFPEEGRVWVGGVPVMPDTRRRVQSLLAEIDLSMDGDARAGGWPRLQRLLARRPASAPGDLLRMLRHVGLEAAREGPAAERGDAAHARARLARALVPRPDHVLVAEVDAVLTEGASSVFLAALRRIVRAEGVAATFTCRSLALAHEHADRLLVLGEGRVVLDGVPTAADDDGDRAPVTLTREW
jgi:ABC-type cobalamin/Fe3+-siderophores transport system ATPase subunit